MNRVAVVAIVGFVAAAALSGCASQCKDHEGGEVAVAMKDLPAAVRATLDRESAGGKVTEVEKEMKNGKTVYSADMVVGGVAWDITIGEDGTVISKEKEGADEKKGRARNRASGRCGTLTELAHFSGSNRMSSFAVALALGAVALSQPAGTSQPVAPPAASAPASGPYHVLATFSVGGEGAWDYLCLDPDGKRLFVPRSTHTMVLDTQSGQVLGDIPDTAGVHGVALAADMGKGFTSNGRAGTVTVFDLTTLKTLSTVKVGDNPDSILFEPTTKRVFTFNGRSKDSSVIDVNDLKVVGTIPMGGKPEFCVADGAGKIYVNIEDTSEILRIDAKSMKVEERFKIAPGEEPSGLAIDTAHKRLFSVCSNQKMIVLDCESGKVLASPAIGKGVDGAAFDAGGGFALASNGDGTMTVVGTKDDKFDVVQTLPTAPRARTVAIDPATRRIYLPTAEFEPAKEAGKDGRPARPTMKPGTFKIVVVTP